MHTKKAYDDPASPGGIRLVFIYETSAMSQLDGKPLLFLAREPNSQLGPTSRGIRGVKSDLTLARNQSIILHKKDGSGLGSCKYQTEGQCGLDRGHNGAHSHKAERYPGTR